MRRRRKSIVRRALRGLVRRVKRRIRNKKLWRKGMHTKKLNRATSQRGGFSL